jgi:hypothetical protein
MESPLWGFKGKGIKEEKGKRPSPPSRLHVYIHCFFLQFDLGNSNPLDMGFSLIRPVRTTSRVGREGYKKIRGDEHKRVL